MEESKKNKTRVLSVTVWESGTGGQDVGTRGWAGHTGQPTRETTERR